jgi:hypothetical protein
MIIIICYCCFPVNSHITSQTFLKLDKYDQITSGVSDEVISAVFDSTRPCGLWVGRVFTEMGVGGGRYRERRLLMPKFAAKFGLLVML